MVIASRLESSDLLLCVCAKPTYAVLLLLLNGWICSPRSKHVSPLHCDDEWQFKIEEQAKLSWVDSRLTSWRRYGPKSVHPTFGRSTPSTYADRGNTLMLLLDQSLTFTSSFGGLLDPLETQGRADAKLLARVNKYQVLFPNSKSSKGESGKGLGGDTDDGQQTYSSAVKEGTAYTHFQAYPGQWWRSVDLLVGSINCYALIESCFIGLLLCLLLRMKLRAPESKPWAEEVLAQFA